MGYRSHVVIFVKHPQAKARFLLSLPDNELFKEYYDQTGEDCFKEDQLLLQWGDIKWYESYPEIQEAMNFYHALAEICEEGYDNNEDVCCAFCRTGEDTDDIEELGTGDYYDYVRVVTSIDINF
jgi:hypothetical protein